MHQLDAKLLSLEIALAQAISVDAARDASQSQPRPQQPQSYNVGTPQHAVPQHADTQEGFPDPFQASRRDPWSRQQPSAEEHRISSMPPGCGSAPADGQPYVSSPFVTPTPPGRAQAATTFPPQQRNPPSGHFPAGFPMNQKCQYMGDQESMNKKTESLKKFNGNPSDLQSWSKHMVDHMGNVHGEWRRVLERIPKYMPDRSFQIATLRMELLGPYNENAAELAEQFEQTLVDWLPERLYNNRVPLAGGDEESGNGFEMWRRLHLNNVGDGEVLEEAGVECLHTYG